MSKKPLELPTKADRELDRLYGELKLHDPETDEYATIMRRIQELSNLNKSEHKPDEKKKLDPNTIIVVAANLLGIVAILAYEHVHPVASKAFSLLLKPKH